MPVQRLFFIGIDELIKFPSYAELLTLVGSTMDKVWELDVPNGVGKCPLTILPMVSSLSSLSVDESVTPYSNRDVAWIPLGPLRGAAEHIVKLFPRLDGSVLVHKALRILCTDLGEHGRMLEKLVDYLRQDDNKMVELLRALNSGAVGGILDALEVPCKAYLSIRLTSDHGLSIVSAALLGQPVIRNARPDDGLDITFENVLSEGTYISSEGSAADIHTFIPVMSPFQLLHWARNAITKHGLVGQVAAVLLRVMSRSPKVDGYVFEDFVCGTCRICRMQLDFYHHHT
jgi:hypothetical protein